MMKRSYISPMSEVVKLRLSSSVLVDGTDIISGSNGAAGGDMQAKRFNTWNSFEDEDEPSAKQQPNVWSE